MQPAPQPGHVIGTDFRCFFFCFRTRLRLRFSEIAASGFTLKSGHQLFDAGWLASEHSRSKSRGESLLKGNSCWVPVMGGLLSATCGSWVTTTADFGDADCVHCITFGAGFQSPNLAKPDDFWQKKTPPRGRGLVVKRLAPPC